MTPPGFEVFLGIDWSGARQGPLKGLRVAACGPGTGAPVLLPGPRRGELWRRRDVLDMVLARQAAGERVLAGFDFAFAYAYADCGAYYPGLAHGPATARELWALVDALSDSGADLYGGAVYRQGSPVAHHYWTSGPRPDGFVERRRRTELACGRTTWPHPVFKCFSAANVGTGSVAGMRLLHRLAGRVAIWPFDAPGRTTVVEIFPRYYVRRQGLNPNRLYRRPAAVQAVLSAYGSTACPGLVLDTEDKVDAVVSAAALRRLSTDPQVWAAPGVEPAAMLEGWIFGVDFANPGTP